jgi:hypothetical protein
MEPTPRGSRLGAARRRAAGVKTAAAIAAVAAFAGMFGLFRTHHAAAAGTGVGQTVGTAATSDGGGYFGGSDLAQPSGAPSVGTHAS